MFLNNLRVLDDVIALIDLATESYVLQVCTSGIFANQNLKLVLSIVVSHSREAIILVL